MIYTSRQSIYAIDLAIVIEDGIPECGNCGVIFPGTLTQIVMGIHAGLECLSCGHILRWVIQNPDGLDYSKGEVLCLRCNRIFIPIRYDEKYCSKKCTRLSGARLA